LASTLWRSGEPAASSILAYPEGRAGLAAANRAGRIDKETYARSLAEFEALDEELISIGIDEHLARSAGDKAAQFGLRGYDAVHLATALNLGGELVVVTWDKDLHRAAEATGLTVAGITNS
jgi:predicted nucleic acid-binding protein